MNMQTNNLGYTSSFSQYSLDSQVHDRGTCSIQQLHIKRNQYLSQLQHETALLEQQQQIERNKQNQIISYQPVQGLIDLLCNWYTNRRIKEDKKMQLEQQLKTKIKQLNTIQEKIKRNQKLVDRFHNKLYVYLLGQLKSVNKLIKYGEQLNIKTIVQSSISKYIYSITHKSKHCHTHSQSATTLKQCGQNCPFQEMISFIKEYKNDNICNRVRQGWIAMEKQLTTQIDSYMEQFGQQINQIGTNYQNDTQTIEHRCRLNKEIMDIKVDLQIVTTEIQIMKAQLKLVQANASAQSAYPNQCGLIANIRCIIVQSFEKQVSNQQTDENKLINKIQKVFYSYYLQIYNGYTQSKQLTNNEYFDDNGSDQEKSMTQMKQENNNIFDATLNKFIQALAFSLDVCRSKFQIQVRIQSIQANLNKVNEQINKHNKEESTKAIFQSFQPNHNLQFDPLFSQQLYSHRNMSQISNKRVSVSTLTHTESKAYINKISIQSNLHHIKYRVKKIMHITTVAPSDQLLINLKLHGNNRFSKNNTTSHQTDRYSGASSRIASRANSRVNILTMGNSRTLKRTPSMKGRKNPQQYNERSLQFGRKKLILHKANPHFHEQIEIKRIQKMKQINQKVIHIYFKKGYMTLQFISNEAKQESEVQRRGLAREWLKYFKVLYYEITDQIQFIDQQGQQLNDMNNYWLRKSAKNREVHGNKQNQNANEHIKKTQYKYGKEIIQVDVEDNKYHYEQLFNRSQHISQNQHMKTSQYIKQRYQEPNIEVFR